MGIMDDKHNDSAGTGKAEAIVGPAEIVDVVDNDALEGGTNVLTNDGTVHIPGGDTEFARVTGANDDTGSDTGTWIETGGGFAVAACTALTTSLISSFRSLDDNTLLEALDGTRDGPLRNED